MKKPQSKKASAKSTGASNVVSASITQGNDRSLNVRKIQNGYIVRTSETKGSGRNQKYVDKEYYSPTNPVQVNISKTKLPISKK